MPDPPKQKVPKGQSTAILQESSTSDPRFASLSTDPRFRLPSRKQRQVKLDKRLGRILKDEEFSKRAAVDRYGRKIDPEKGKRELERLYRLESDEEEEDGGQQDEDEKVVKELKRMDRKYDPAREGGFSTSESESESEEEDDDNDEEDSEEGSAEEETKEAEEVDAELPEETKDSEVPMGDISSRIAVVNLDWDNIRAIDLMAVANSFVPTDGRILDVTVYPSEFGRERMEREEVEGPPKEIFQTSSTSKTSNSKSRVAEQSDDDELEGYSSSSDDEEIKKELLKEDSGADFDSAALRRYQLDRLRYYYAVITCSSNEVAKALYDDMDGREYLSSANFFDLRFVPAEVRFDTDKPRDSCKDIPDGYKPTEFVTHALTHSNVKLTWDADDMERKEVQKRAFSRKEMDENDLMAYIASASSSSEEEEEDELLDEDGPDADLRSTTSKATTRQNRRDALRAALGLDLEPIPEKKSKKRDDKHVGDMQITFTPALSRGDRSGKSVFTNDMPPQDETTAEKYVRKERERKARRKEKAKTRRDGPDGPEKTEEISKNGSGERDVHADDDDRNADPFNDPFFTKPRAAAEQAKKDRKIEKQQKRREREADEATQNAKREELELLLADQDGIGQGMRHIDVREIEKAERDARRKHSKKDKRKRKDGESNVDPEPEMELDMDVDDPRFSKLFESHEFAIDPTNPKFRDTKGMRKLLEESRKRRAEAHDKAEPKPHRKRERGPSAKEEDLSELVEKVKKKAKR